MGKVMNDNWYALRWKVLNRDGFACRYCGQKAPSIMLQVDHIVAKANGGTSDMTNLITACSACNIGKNLTPLTIPTQQLQHSRKHRANPHERICGYLKANQWATATEISKALDINRGNVSHILATDQAHFIYSHRDQRNVYYKLNGRLL